MPTKKHRIMFLMNEKYQHKFEKLKDILHRRSDSDLAMAIIAEYIDRYEKENGSIEGD